MKNGIRRQSPRYDYNVQEENEILKGSSEEVCLFHAIILGLCYDNGLLEF
jgi:hypothetical protein